MEEPWKSWTPMQVGRSHLKQAGLKNMEEIAAWITNVLAPQSGEVQIETVKQRPWSIVVRVTANQGISYFKACGSGGRHELALLRWLEKVVPAMIPTILATSIDRGWLLLADAGIGLRDRSTAEQILYLEKLLPHYAELQRDSIEQIEALLQMQVPDRRLEQLPFLLHNLLETESASGTIDSSLRIRVLNSIPKLERYQHLATSRYAAAIDQGDLHTGNILIKAGIARICDWGDACITHPFCSLFPLLQPLKDKVEDEIQSRLIDAYLEPWTSFNSAQILRSELRQAFQISHILRALDMAHMLKGADQSDLKQWSPYISECLSQWCRLLDTLN